ncbi:ATP-binding protein [Pseudomonas sp. B21-032]|uniref:ATP-binding protein n=1 Tax=Pseudomonas sp. B21-032 TaxID=2895483 RepID=UPI0021608E70|nr:ATP-binding protein [Pseudomonas sp. B21-032]UVL64163.1 ATP-binding protein [Pseudomonas sp. B21-032]
MDYEHPILSTEYLLNTPTVMAVVQNACFKVLMRKTGVVFTGEPRIGKTRCCEALVKEIPKKFPKVYTFMIVATNKDLNQQYSSIIHQLIELERLNPKPRATFIQRQAMLIERLKHRAAERKAKQIVLIIDELQRLSARDFDQLADLYNTLRMNSITLTVISFAMPSIEKRVVEFLENDFQHMIGRFLSDIKPLFGVTSLRNLSTVLALYDDECAEGSTSSYTKSSIPRAYSGGFRMSSLADDIWREMSRVASGKYVQNLPMEHVTQVVSYLFLIFSHEDNESLNAPQDLISEAVRESNFEQFCRKIDQGDV